jgi:hypothetical protein
LAVFAHLSDLHVGKHGYPTENLTFGFCFNNCFILFLKNFA